MNSDINHTQVTAKELGINPRTFYNWTSGPMVDSVPTSNINKKI